MQTTPQTRLELRGVANEAGENDYNDLMVAACLLIMRNSTKWLTFSSSKPSLALISKYGISRFRDFSISSTSLLCISLLLASILLPTEVDRNISLIIL